MGERYLNHILIVGRVSQLSFVVPSTRIVWIVAQGGSDEILVCGIDGESDPSDGSVCKNGGNKGSSVDEVHLVDVVHPPFTLIRTTGLLSQFGISQMFQFYAFAIAIEFNGLSVSEMFYFRYKAGLLNYREHRFTYYLRTFVYLTRFIAIFNVCFCIFTIHDASEFQQNHKAVMFHNNPSLSFLNCSNLYLVIPFADYVSSIILTTWIVQTASLIASVPGTVVYISHNVPKSISAATWKIQQQLLLSLIIQTAIHGIMLGIPNAMFIYALFFGFTNEYIAYTSFVCLTYHGFVSTFAMIVFTRPLREYVLSAMKIRKASIGTGIMNAIYTAVLVASTLAYTAVAWIGLSIDAANEDLI
ncbi:hypothetical protein GCK72_019352 [Caenorhabditis remanei]|uniref:Uncharacterized protein n=1 Tax=Caenorhabditis remanei TaxID=31234 RepID=A0A6A5GC26_CAERE|nr:hypothetical protein GCK72_019352 [Caenorhabditis remanei]KAF1752797.1 hypothetical protein GCK72_019352 [Caenorhabditis remanei]